MNFPGGSNVLRTDTNFPGGFIEKTCFFEEVLSVRRTDLIFSLNVSVFLPGIFQEGTPRQTDISLIGLGGCFRFYLLDFQNTYLSRPFLRDFVAAFESRKHN